MTGTIVEYPDIDAGVYFIVHNEPTEQKWYALATDGTCVDVTEYYDASSASISGYPTTVKTSRGIL